MHYFIIGDVIIPLSHIFSHGMSNICWVEDLSLLSKFCYSMLFGFLVRPRQIAPLNILIKCKQE